MYDIRIMYTNGQFLTVTDVEEFVAGFKYLYVRTETSTLSFNREELGGVFRKLKNSASDKWLPILMKRPKAGISSHS